MTVCRHCHVTVEEREVPHQPGARQWAHVLHSPVGSDIEYTLCRAPTTFAEPAAP